MGADHYLSVGHVTISLNISKTTVTLDTVSGLILQVSWDTETHSIDINWFNLLINIFSHKQLASLFQDKSYSWNLY